MIKYYRLLSIFVLAWLYSSGMGQAQGLLDYTFTPSSGTFTSIEGGTGTVDLITSGTLVTPSDWNSATSLRTNFISDLPIGFNFFYLGNNYDAFAISTNGFISLGQGGTTSLTSAQTTNNLDFGASPTTGRPFLAPLWDDMEMDAMGMGYIGYQLSGMAGTQILTVEWKNVEYDNTANEAVISFQVKIYEATGVIEFIYGDTSPAVLVPTAADASVGITDVAEGDDNAISLQDVSAAPTISYTVETTGIDDKPADGQVYTFSPASDATLSLAQAGVGIANAGTFDFGGAIVPNPDTRTFTISNVGTAALTVNSITLAAGSDPQFGAPTNFSTMLPATLAFGESMTFDVTFTPTTEGDAYTGSVEVASNDPDDNPYVMNLAGSGALSGATCANAVAVTDAGLPYNDLGATTCGYGDEYSTSPCNNFYMGGEEKIYTYTNSTGTDQTIRVTMSNVGSTWSGLHVLDGCPDVATTCLGSVTNSATTDRVVDFTAVAGQTYHIAISTWPNPNCVTSYNLNIRELFPDDVGVTAISTNAGLGREGTCDVLGTANVVATITNFGTNTQTAFDVSYQVGAGTPVVESWTGSLAPGASVTHTFTTQTEDFSGAPLSITACTALTTPADDNTSNDCTTQDIGNIPNPVLAFTDFPKVQDFEAADAVTITGTTDYIFAVGGLDEVDFKTDATNGRLQTTFAGITFASGTKGIVLDRATFGTNPRNDVFFTYNMSSFDANNDKFELDIWLLESDEESTNGDQDRVWVRGSCTDPWVEIYNWNIGNFHALTNRDLVGADISATLVGAGQNYTSSFGIRIGQSDNSAFTTDGLAIDDLVIRYVPPVPDIEVEGNGVVIADGDTTPDTADDTDFGDVNVSTTVGPRTFTVKNTGALPLGLSLPITSSNPNFFIIYTGPSLIAAGDSETFDVYYTAPGTAILDMATITVNSNDPDMESAYTFDVQANALIPSPELELQGNSTVINCGDGPSLATGSDFGDVAITGGTNSNSFDIISNTTSDVVVTDIQISGTNMADFTLTPVPTFPMTVSPIQSFTITFDPSDVGLRTATVTITSNDGGTAGTTCTFDIQGNGADNNIQVTGNTVVIPGDDSNVPDAADLTDFGAVSATATPPTDAITHTFVVENTGDADLNMSNITIMGADFSFGTVPTFPSTISPGGSESFEIIFNPSSVGIFLADVTVISDDIDEPNYSFNIRGEGLAPAAEIVIEGAGMEIVNGDDTPSTMDDTDFGDVALTSPAVSRTFTISNIGEIDLNLTGSPDLVTIAGAAEFTVTQPANNVVAVAGVETFDVVFTPNLTLPPFTTIGAKTATVTVESDDADEASYTFDVQANAVDAQALVTGNGFPIANGDATPQEADNTDFGQVDVGNTVTREFVLTNIGDADLTVNSMQILEVLTAPGTFTDFTLVSPTSFPFTLAPSQFVTITVSGTPSSIGEKLGTVSISTNDFDNLTYNFRVSIEGVAPEVTVSGGVPASLQEITNGDTSPTVDDGTDYGSVLVGSAGDISTFYIINGEDLDGDGMPDNDSQLLISDITFTGANAGDFTLVDAPPSEVVSGDTVTFTVRFIPGAVGLRTATIEITNNDADEGTYTFNVQGEGLEETTTSLPTDLANADLVIYPNPSQGIFRVKVEGNAGTEGFIQIFDSRGSNVHNQKVLLSNGETEFNLSKVASGKYIAIIQLGKERIARTIVKE